MILNEYLRAQNKTNEAVITNAFNSDELNRFSKADFRWADNRTKQFRHRTVKKGEIYQFEFGKNYKPEMSYEHRGLVIGVKKKLLYVLPVFSYDSSKHPDVYHPVESPASKSDLFLMKSSDFPFLSHDSVLKLNDIRTVSINRILYQQTGQIPILSDTYKQIEQLVLQKYFPGFYHEFTQERQNISLLEEKLKESVDNKKVLEAENRKLQNEIQSLKDKLKAVEKQ